VLFPIFTRAAFWDRYSSGICAATGPWDPKVSIWDGRETQELKRNLQLLETLLSILGREGGPGHSREM
jgi:hypothetical protein